MGSAMELRCEFARKGSSLTTCKLTIVGDWPPLAYPFKIALAEVSRFVFPAPELATRFAALILADASWLSNGLDGLARRKRRDKYRLKACQNRDFISSNNISFRLVKKPAAIDPDLRGSSVSKRIFQALDPVLCSAFNYLYIFLQNV